MTLKNMSDQILILEEPRSLFRMSVFILTMLGALGTVAVLLSDEPLAHGVLYFFFW